MTKPHPNTTQDISEPGLGGWFRAALLIFALTGAVEWALAVNASSGVGVGGAVTGALLFASMWVLGGSVWAVVSGGALWFATGAATATPLVGRLWSTAKRWWDERHTTKDARRLATLVAAGLTLALFIGGSLALTANLIANRNGAWLIAIASLVGQGLLGAGLLVVGLSVRRLLSTALVRIRQKWWPSWLHTPGVLVTLSLVTLVAAVVGVSSNIDVFRAVEGPSFALIGLAVALHPLAAWVLDARWKPASGLRRAIWAAPVLAVVAIGVTSQHSDARRLLVLDGASAQFAFNGLTRHVDLDGLFQRGDCPPLNRDGLPADGTSLEAYEANCMDPAHDRPVARREVPNFERPDLEEPPSFLFITWDSVRADRLGFMGHDGDTTPNLDEFSQESLVFDYAFAQDSGTGPSFWSLLAGQTPFQVDLTRGDRFPPTISPDEEMLGEVLSEAGYRTESVMCGSVFDNKDWGIRRGFQNWQSVCGRKKHQLAPIVAEKSIPTLERLTKGDEPFFLWVHFYDVHHPYTDHDHLFFGTDKLGRYDEELRYTDEYTAGLIDAAKAAGAERPLYTIFGADHGENFNEHGSDPHARNLYRIVTQVPKMIHGPGIEPRRVEAPVAFNDVYPTVLDLADIDIPEAVTMVSQVPVLFGAPADDERMVFQENSYSRPRRHTRAVVYGRYHYIMDLTTNTHELYDYVEDPIELRNLAGQGLIEEQIMRQALVRFLQTSEIPEGMED